MWDRIKLLYQTPNAETLAVRELDNAKRALLEAQSAKEYAESMCKYHDARIKRLSSYLQLATGSV